MARLPALTPMSNPLDFNPCKYGSQCASRQPAHQIKRISADAFNHLIGKKPAGRLLVKIKKINGKAQPFQFTAKPWHVIILLFKAD